MTNTKILWEDRPSQGVNLGIFLSCVLVVPFPWAWWQYKRVEHTRYILKEEKLVIQRGVRSIQQEDIFLDEIKEVKIQSPLWLRLTGLQSITLFFRDETNPPVNLSGLKEAETVKSRILQQIAEARQVKTALQRDD